MIFNYKSFLLEYINKHTINLQEEFDKLNKELFNGELKPIELKWEKNKNSGGRVISTRYPDKTEIINYLGISDYMEYEYDTFKNILAHEMIHVYIIQNNIKDYGGKHGIFFKEKMEEINKKGYNITIDFDATNLMVSGQEKLNNPLCVIIILNKKDNTKFIDIWNMKLYTDGSKELYIEKYNRIAEYYKRNYELIFIESNNPNLKKYPMKRKYENKPKYVTYVLNDDLYDQLMNDKILDKIEITVM